MATSTLAAEPDYSNRAFTSQYNLILLFAAVSYSIASYSWKPLAVGLVVEFVWLLLGPRLPAFRRSVDAEADQARRSEIERTVAAAADRLESGYRPRVTAVDVALSELTAGASTVEDTRLAATLRSLDAARPAFARLCQLHQRISQFLAINTEPVLRQEVTRLQQSLTGEKDFAVRIALRQGLTLAERRFDQRRVMLGLQRAAELRVETIERSLGHLRAQGSAGRSSSELIGELRALLEQLEAVPALEAESSKAAPQPSVPPSRARA